MRSSDFPRLILLLCVSIGNSLSLDFKFMFDNHSANVLELLIPTVHSANEICRKHSLLYQEELQKFTVWATDMFDASTKFPSGIFFGSAYDTGNFDECIQVHIPGKLGFSGQHCMARLKIRPLKPETVNEEYDPENEDYEKLFNISTWSKIAKYGQDISKQSRDEAHITFCIPSSCTYKDLENVLKLKIHSYKDILPVNLDVTVYPRNCQVQKEFQLTKMDSIFIAVVGIAVFLEVICTIYHLLTASVKFDHLTLSGRKHDILKAFSFYNTVKKLSSACNRESGLECIHGLKVLSVFMVIMGHRLMFFIGSPLGNPSFIEQYYLKAQYYCLFSGDVIIDTFLTTSGLLACYLILSEIHRRKQMINPLVMYLHRFIRLTPAYAVVLGFYCTIFIQMGSGPFWEERVGVEQERCLSSWWTNLLYINNYVKVDQICMFQSWYLSCDTHYFFIVPFLIYFLWRRAEIGLILCIFLTAISAVIPILVIYIFEKNPGLLLYMKLLKDPVMNPSFQKTYIPSHMRAAPYFVGVLAGFLKFKIQSSKSNISNIIKYSSWTIWVIIICVIQFLAFLFYRRREETNFLFSGIYESMHHFLWSLCVAWCILAVSEGCGEWIAPILNWKPWIILSRLTYTTYLCHGAFQLYSVGIIRNPGYAGVFSIVYSVTSDIVLAYIAGFFLSLCFESPIMELEKIFFNRPSASGETLSSQKVKKIGDINEDAKLNLGQVCQLRFEANLK